MDLDRMLRLRFVAEKDWVSSAIKWYEGVGVGPSHVDLVLPDDTYLGARSDGGVRIRPADYIPAAGIGWERRYAIPVEPEALAKMYVFARAQLGKPYDFSNILGFALHQNWDDAERWICSELALATAEAGGLWMLNVQPGFTHRIDPGRLHLSPMLIGRRYYPEAA
jgi:hypothetical protein